jgi:hypothetical protein
VEDLAQDFSVPCPSYGPSDPALFSSFPISHSDLVLMIYPFTCALHPDHYKVAYAKGSIGVGTLVKV